MRNGMTTRPKAKLAISISPELLAKVKAAVSSGRARSVSAYVEHAVAGQLAAEADFDLVLAEVFARTGGRPTAAERARARKHLRGAA
jgi:hypothetical protein